MEPNKSNDNWREMLRAASIDHAHAQALEEKEEREKEAARDKRCGQALEAFAEQYNLPMIVTGSTATLGRYVVIIGVVDNPFKTAPLLHKLVIKPQVTEALSVAQMLLDAHPEVDPGFPSTTLSVSLDETETLASIHYALEKLDRKAKRYLSVAERTKVKEERKQQNQGKAVAALNLAKEIDDFDTLEQLDRDINQLKKKRDPGIPF